MAYSQLSYDPWEITPQERKARFVGREGLLQQVLGAIAEQQQHDTVQHYLLLGPRGIGKTTLLLTLRETIRESRDLSTHWFCVQLREEEYFVRTLRDLLELTLQSLADDEGVPGAEEAVQRVRQEPKEDRSLALAIDSLRSLASSQGKRILLLMDNFDRVFPATATGRGKKRPPENEFRSFRKLLSTESFLMVVGASVRLFQEIAAYDRAFFNFFCPIEVPDLSDDEINQLLRRCAEAEGNTRFLAQFEAIRNKVRAITFMTGGNPRLVLMLYDVLRHREMTPVVEALRETVGGLTPLLKHILDDMPRQQSKTLDALVRLRGAAAPARIAEMARLPLNVVTTQLGRLKESRFVVSDGDGKGKPATYRISDPMFQTWYQMRYLRPAGRRVELFVEFIRAWFSVEERRQFLNEQWAALGNGGKRKEAFQECCLTIQYYAAAMEDVEEARSHFERLADTFAEAGSEREAAMLLAESFEASGLTGKRYESEGYRLLGERRMKKGDPAKAIETYRRALSKDPGNVDAELGLAMSLWASGESAKASAAFDRIIAAKAPIEQLSKAYLTRGLMRVSLGDRQEGISDFTALTEMPGAPIAQVVPALFMRAWAKEQMGDKMEALTDYTALVQMSGVPPAAIAVVLLQRGDAKRSLGDTKGAIADYTTLIELPDAPVEQAARALVNRGLATESSEDKEGAVADYTAAIEMADAPAEPLVIARFNRGTWFFGRGEIDRALLDYESAVSTPGISRDQKAAALGGSGAALIMLDRQEEGIARLGQALELKPSQDAVYAAFHVLMLVHGVSDQPAHAARWMSRLHEFEAAETPIERRLEVRIRAILDAGEERGPEAAESLLEAALRGGPEDIRARLEYLSPAIQYAKTGDDRALANLPEPEREVAKKIAATITAKKDAAPPLTLPAPIPVPES